MRLRCKLLTRCVTTSLTCILLCLASAVALRAAVPTRQEHERTRAWVAAYFSTSWPAANLPPFSFLYDGKPSSELLKTWKLSIKPEVWRGADKQQSYSYTDPVTGLEVTCELTQYADFPAVEWVLYFRNTGDAPTPILQDVRALDVRFRSSTAPFVLHRALGSGAGPGSGSLSFAPVEEILEPGMQVVLKPVGGRSSNTNALPFFNLEARARDTHGEAASEHASVETLDGGGVMIGVGWSGQWSARFVRDAESVHIQTGMELTQLRLLPGERIRTPRTLLLFWRSPDRLRGHNLLRSFILAHHSPRPGGREIALPVAAMSFFQSNSGEEVTERNQIEFASLYLQKGIPIDHFWLDAGWFEGGWASGIGNWFPKKKAFPNGLKPLSDAVHKMGLRFILWFEPERVLPGTWLATHHSEWLLGKDKKLLNLGNAEARRWLIEHISGMIDHDGIDVYRHDFNMDPLPYWRSTDEPERQGMTEIRYVEGLYDFWDELLRRHPKLLIDNCASGGRRLDLETISRSVALWRVDSDYGDPIGPQAQGVGLGLYIPLNTAAVPTKPGMRAELPDLYIARSAMGPGLVLAWDVRRPDFDDALARHFVEQHKRIRKFFYGDLYPLTPITADQEAWLAYQYDRPDLREGMIMAFRREKSTEESLTVKLRGLTPNWSYNLEDVGTGIVQTATGKELAEGLRLNIPTAPGSVLLVYKIRKGRVRKHPAAP